MTRPPTGHCCELFPNVSQAPTAAVSGSGVATRPPEGGREAVATPEQGLRLNDLGATPTLAATLVLFTDPSLVAIRALDLRISAGKASGLHGPTPRLLTTGALGAFHLGQSV